MNARIVLCVCVALGLSATLMAGEAGKKDSGKKKAGSEAVAKAAGMASMYDTAGAGEPGETTASLVVEGTWKKVGEGVKPASFLGAAALVNESIAALVRKDGAGVDIYAKGAEGWTRRARLGVVVGEEAAKIGSVKGVANDGATAAVECGVGGGQVTFAMNAGEPVLRATAKGNGATAVRFDASCRLGVLPDFLADDLMIDARSIPIDQTEIPSENMFLLMVGDGNAILAAAWEKNERDMVVRFSGGGPDRKIVSADIFFGSDGGRISTAVLEQKNIWHSREVAREEAIKGLSMTEWDVPFLAKWKGNFTREDKRTESIQFADPRSSLVRKGGRITAVLDIESRKVGQERDQDPKAEGYVGLSGVGVIYPITRSEETPLDRLCADDLLRLCLGTGPCESILDLDARKPQSKGIFTCSYGGMFKRVLPEAEGHERNLALRVKDERFFLRRYNRNMMTFVRNVHNRINGYVDFGLKMLAYLDGQEKGHPELAEFIGRINAEWALPVAQYARPRIFSNTEKSNNEERAAEFLKEFDKAISIDTPDQLSKGMRGAGQIPGAIGDPGDRRLRNLRRKVMVIRAMATMETAVNPAAVEVAKEIRKLTDEVLRNPHSYEKVTVW